jgi:hypothetical protein
MSGGAAFSRGGALALVAAGCALFLAMLYLMGAGEDFGGERGQGQAHAASNGLNGYSGLYRLVEAQGYDVERSRSPTQLETSGLLVLTPAFFGDGKEVNEILENRRFRGPTLVIMPKWTARTPAPNLPPEIKGRFKRGWVTLGPARASEWPEVLATSFSFKHKIFPKPVNVVEAMEIAIDPATGQPAPQPVKADAPAPPPPPQPGRWSGMGLSGVLPTSSTLYAEPGKGHETLITDGAGRVLAFEATSTLRQAVRTGNGPNPDEYTVDDNPAYPVIFLAEPDLANNYGLADPQRAAAAIALVEQLTEDGDIYEVTFDLTLNGFGASENLLTLAFRPPFLAATLSLLVALLIVAWRAFQRFGPPAAPAGPDIAFGKRQLIANGAGLIVRARRFGLLGAPYAALSARRLAERLGLARPDPEAIDAALARRLPQEEPFTRRAARMEAAEKPADLVTAAQALDDLSTKLSEPANSGTKTR